MGSRKKRSKIWILYEMYLLRNDLQKFEGWFSFLICPLSCLVSGNYSVQRLCCAWDIFSLSIEICVASITINRQWVWTLNKKAAMSWWPDPEMSCVLCFVQKSSTVNIDANAKISNGVDKACETKNKRERCLVMFELAFEGNPPIWSRSLEEMLVSSFANDCKWPRVVTLLLQIHIMIFILSWSWTQHPHISSECWNAEKLKKGVFNKNAFVPLTAPVATPW